MSSKEIYPLNDSIPSNIDFLSEYNIKGIIGKGTFSVVKLGEHKKTKEKVAIKILQKNKIISKDDLIRIEREIEILKKLKHPNVIKIHRIDEDKKNFYIIMEFCENGELFNRIVEKQHLTEEEAALFYYQLINGLEYIHKNNIVHRDLKPENLLLSKNDLLKIIDFGLSNYTHSDLLLETPCGSPCYASPEMVSGKKYDGYMIDVWSTGIILFAMVCGYLPFEDNDNEILFGKILKCRIHYPKTMGTLTLDLMKKIITPNPKKRITLEQIKEHPLYLKGKNLFSKKYPDLIGEIEGKDIKSNNSIKEIIIKNVKPIVKNKIRKSIEENKSKDKANNKKNKSLNLNEINSTYISYHPERKKETDIIVNTTNIANKEPKEIIKPKTKTKEPIEIINPQAKTIEPIEIITPQTKTIETIEIIEHQTKTIEKENIDKNIAIKNNRKDTTSSLNSDEIPKDSVPKDKPEDKKDIPKEKEKFENNKIKEVINTINLTEQNNKKIHKIYNINPKTKKDKDKDNNKLKQGIINLEKNVILNKNRTIEKDKKKNINKDINYLVSSINKINDTLIENLIRKDKLNNTIDTSTTISNKMDYYHNNNTIDSQRNKHTIVESKVPKTNYSINKVYPVYDTKTKKEINYNDYTENKTSHNNYSKIIKINNTFDKRIHRKPIYDINNISERNIETNTENNMNLTNINNYAYTKNLRMGYYNYNYDCNTYNNTINGNNHKNNLNDIFNEMELTQKNRKTLTNEDYNFGTLNPYDINNSFKNKEISLKKGKNLKSVQNKEIIFNNNYIDRKNNNNIKSNEFLSYKGKNVKKVQNTKPKKISKKLISPENISIINNNNNNSLPYQSLSTINDRYFESITINNNNNINLHDTKLYIYLENNNENNPTDYQRIRTESNPNQTKRIFKFSKKNNNTSKIRNINKITPMEYNKNILNKITNNKTIDNDINNKQFQYKMLSTKNNQNINNDKIYYNPIGIKKNANYNFKTNNDNYKRNKDNVKYMINRNTDIINDKINYYNSNNRNFDNNMIIHISNTSKSIEKNKADNYINKNMHNFINSDLNLNIWSSDNQRIYGKSNNIIMNNYVNNNNQGIIKGKNFNLFNNKADYTFDNIDYEINRPKIQNKSYMTINNNNENIKNIVMQKNNEINNTMKPFNNYRRINPIIAKNLGTPINKQNYKIITKFKKI